MNELVKDFYDIRKDVFAQPQVWRGIEFFPLKLRDTRAQTLFYKVFQWPQKFIQDEQIQKLSYLVYLTQIIGHNEKDIVGDLTELLEFITHKKVEFYYKFNEDNSDFLSNIEMCFTIGEEKFEEKDFDVVREIILLQQNLSSEWVESYDPTLEEMLNYENSKHENLTFEEEVFKLCSLLGCSVDTIGNYSIYQYKKHFEQAILLFQYNTYAPLEISGQISSKTGKKIVEPYFSHISDNGRYGSILIPLDEFLGSHQDPDMRGIDGKSVMKIDDKK